MARRTAFNQGFALDPALRSQAPLRAGARRAGFTLFEILIAVSILGTALVVVVGHVNHAVRMYRVARETIVATAIARAKLDEISAATETIRELTEGGPVKDDDRFRYRLEVREWQLPGFDKGEVKGLFRAESVVEWDSGVTRRVKLVQIVTQPAPEERQR